MEDLIAALMQAREKILDMKGVTWTERDGCDSEEELVGFIDAAISAAPLLPSAAKGEG